jgi:hypothetical protein
LQALRINYAKQSRAVVHDALDCFVAAAQPQFILSGWLASQPKGSSQ